MRFGFYRSVALMALAAATLEMSQGIELKNVEAIFNNAPLYAVQEDSQQTLA